MRNDFFVFTFLYLVFGVYSVFANVLDGVKFPDLKISQKKVEQVSVQGVPLFLSLDSEFPVVEITVYVRAGFVKNINGKYGVTDLCATLIRNGGTKNRTYEEIDRILENLSITIEAHASVECTKIYLFCLVEDLDVGLDVLFEMLKEPTFNEKRLSLYKNQMLELVRRKNDKPFSIAKRVFKQSLYPKNHILSVELDKDMLESIQRKDVEDFYNENYHLSQMMFAVSGDVNKDDIVAKLDRHFQTLDIQKKDTLKLPLIDVMPELDSKITVFNRDVEQVSILMGRLGIRRHNDDMFILKMLNEILGGNAFSSRLFKNIRDKHGLAYWVQSSFSYYFDYGTVNIAVQTGTENVNKAIRLILEEVKNIFNHLVLDEELDLAKDSISNSFVFLHESAHDVCVAQMGLYYYGYNMDYYDVFLDRIRSVSKQDILRVAKKYFDINTWKIVIVGKKDLIVHQVEEYGDVLIQEIDD